jgi:hypothetical protein
MPGHSRNWRYLPRVGDARPQFLPTAPGCVPSACSAAVPAAKLSDPSTLSLPAVKEHTSSLITNVTLLQTTCPHFAQVSNDPHFAYR